MQRTTDGCDTSILVCDSLCGNIAQGNNDPGIRVLYVFQDRWQTMADMGCSRCTNATLLLIPWTATDSIIKTDLGTIDIGTPEHVSQELASCANELNTLTILSATWSLTNDIKQW